MSQDEARRRSRLPESLLRRRLAYTRGDLIRLIIDFQGQTRDVADVILDHPRTPLGAEMNMKSDLRLTSISAVSGRTLHHRSKLSSISRLKFLRCHIPIQ